MLAYLRRSDWRGLGANLILFVGACLLANGLLFGLGFTGGASPRGSSLIPPDWIVGCVWVVLFCAMAIAQWRLNAGQAELGKFRFLIPALALLCLAYPAYTSGLKSPAVGLIGNFVTVLAAIAVTFLVQRLSSVSAALISLVALWVGYASIALLQILV